MHSCAALAPQQTKRPHECNHSAKSHLNRLQFSAKISGSAGQKNGSALQHNVRHSYTVQHYLCSCGLFVRGCPQNEKNETIPKTTNTRPLRLRHLRRAWCTSSHFGSYAFCPGHRGSPKIERNRTISDFRKNQPRGTNDLRRHLVQSFDFQFERGGVQKPNCWSSARSKTE
jgi:hypothetical protein